MIVLTLNNITNLNVSLQIGDLIYAKRTKLQVGAEDYETKASGSIIVGSSLGAGSIVGTLVDINMLAGANFINPAVELIVDNSGYTGNVPADSFIMFSKYDQSMGDVIGYYAKARFVNYSTEKAEIFSVGSEVIINSK